MTSHHALDMLVCGYAKPVRSRKVFAIMAIEPQHVAYVDESGGSAPGRILLLSACIHRYEVWAEFSDAWDKVLKEEPSIPSFHMKAARQRDFPFEGWKQIDVDRKVIALTEVLLKYRPHIISCYVSEAEYARTIRAAGPPDLKHAYFLCFLCIVNKVAQYCQEFGITTPVDYVFDEIGDVGYEAQMWYPAMKSYFPPEVQALMGSTPIFRSDEEVLPLQAADLIAWHKRREKEYPGLDPKGPRVCG